MDPNAAVNAEAAAFPDDYCGKYLNNGFRADLPQAAFVSMWRANLDIHAGAIRARTRPTDQLAFVGCRFSYAELRKVQDEISTDASGWLATLPAAWTSIGPDEIRNRVEMAISSEVRDAADRVLAHYTDAYALPTGILHVWSDGNGAALRPWGTIRLAVLGRDGKPVHVANDLYVQWSGDLPNLDCGNGDQAVGVNPDGAPSEFPCQAGRWRISIDTGPDTATLGMGTVTVAGGRTAELTITVSAVPSPHP